MENENVKSVTLSNGKKADVRKATFKDQRMAGREVNPTEDPIGFLGAMISQTTQVDGKEITLEDVDALSVLDTNAIVDAMQMGNVSIGRMSLNSRS